MSLVLNLTLDKTDKRSSVIEIMDLSFFIFLNDCINCKQEFLLLYTHGFMFINLDVKINSLEYLVRN